MQSYPLVITLQLDSRSFKFFNDLRKKHFPAQLNFLEAHLTLFHHLPQDEEICTSIEQVASANPKFLLQVSRIFKLGAGIAYRVESELLTSVHHRLASDFRPLLTPQDRQPFRPHVTIQNKVRPEDAALLFDDLARQFTPFIAMAEGIETWEYQGGPWKHLYTMPFTGS